MKRNIYLSFATFAIVFFSCNKKLEVRDARFDVVPNKTTLKVGEPIIFSFDASTGTDILNFYSGETNNEYEYSYGVGPGRYSINKSGYNFSFQSRFDYNNPLAANIALFGLQKDQLTVLASKDFDGQLLNIFKPGSNWVNITNKFTLPAAMHASTFTNSGNSDLADIYEKGKPLYIAFKLATKKQEKNGFTQFWNVQNFAVTAKDAIGAAFPKVYDQNKLEFTFVHVVEDTSKSRISRATSASNLLRMGGPEAYLRAGMDTVGIDSLTKTRIVANPNYRDPDYLEVWAVSRPIRTDSVFLGYDKPTANNIVEFKSVQFSQSFGYIYKTPGTYKAVFAGINSSKDETKTITKEFTITVTP